MPHLPHATATPLPWSHTAATAWRALSVVLLLVVTALALMPTVPRDLSLGWDKLNHASAFCALAVAWRLGFPGSAWRWVQLAGGLMVLGAGIEVAQHFVPGRQADAADLLADAIGTAAGMALAALLEWVIRRRMSPRSGTRAA
jgi:VanZ family protein